MNKGINQPIQQQYWADFGGNALAEDKRTGKTAAYIIIGVVQSAENKGRQLQRWFWQSTRSYTKLLKRKAYSRYIPPVSRL